MEELIVMAPQSTLEFFLKVLRFGFCGGGLVMMPTIGWMIWGESEKRNHCEGFLRAWMILRITIFIVQLPVRWKIFITMKEIQKKSREEGVEALEPLIALSRSLMWKINHAVGVLLYILFGSLIISLYHFWSSSKSISGTVYYILQHYFTAFFEELKVDDVDVSCDFSKSPYLVLTVIHLLFFLIHMFYSYYNLRQLIALLFPYEEARGIPLDIIESNTKLDIYSKIQHAESSCPICYEDYAANVSIRVLRCNHFYHKDCIDSWLSQKKMCPTCMRDVTVPNKSPLLHPGNTMLQGHPGADVHAHMD